MGEALLTTFSIDKNQPSTLLSMDSGLFFHEDLEREITRSVNVLRAPDINLPLSSELSQPPIAWNNSCNALDVGLGSNICEAEPVIAIPKVAKKCAKRLDSVWGAWFFFTFYFKPVLNEKSKGKIIQDSNGLSGYEKSDLQLDSFLVQHDMENMYMWVFKERPENALGKMQLRSYMNGHSRQGERPFPFSVDRGFVRSHRMQRKHYRGLSNPQCVHGIEVVCSPNLMGLDEEERKKWMELTGRDINFSVPPEASDFGSWRNSTNTELELERPQPPLKSSSNSHQLNGKLLNGLSLNLPSHIAQNGNSNGMNLSPVCNKRRRELTTNGNVNSGLGSIPNSGIVNMNNHPIETPWVNEFSGVMKDVCGPVTAAKTIYEDDKGFLILVSLPFSDLQRVKVTWKNTPSHGIVKISCVSTACLPTIKRHNRTFKLTDQSPEHCPPGEYTREIPLPIRIPEDAKLEAYCDETGTTLEVIVPKRCVGPEEHEVHVCLRLSPRSERAFVDLKESLV